VAAAAETTSRGTFHRLANRSTISRVRPGGQDRMLRDDKFRTAAASAMPGQGIPPAGAATALLADEATAILGLSRGRTKKAHPRYGGCAKKKEEEAQLHALGGRKRNTLAGASLASDGRITHVEAEHRVALAQQKTH
jgi:hypothetical protein